MIVCYGHLLLFKAWNERVTKQLDRLIIFDNNHLFLSKKHSNKVSHFNLLSESRARPLLYFMTRPILIIVSYPLPPKLKLLVENAWIVLFCIENDVVSVFGLLICRGGEWTLLRIFFSFCPLNKKSICWAKINGQFERIVSISLSCPWGGYFGVAFTYLTPNLALIR